MDKLREVVQDIVQSVGADVIFGATREKGAIAVVPVAKVSVIGGAGGAHRALDSSEALNSQEHRAENPAGRGSGGGFAMAVVPVGYIEICPEGARYKRIPLPPSNAIVIALAAGCVLAVHCVASRCHCRRVRQGEAGLASGSGLGGTLRSAVSGVSASGSCGTGRSAASEVGGGPASPPQEGAVESGGHCASGGAREGPGSASRRRSWGKVLWGVGIGVGAAAVATWLGMRSHCAASSCSSPVSAAQEAGTVVGGAAGTGSGVTGPASGTGVGAGLGKLAGMGVGVGPGQRAGMGEGVARGPAAGKDPHMEAPHRESQPEAQREARRVMQAGPQQETAGMAPPEMQREPGREAQPDPHRGPQREAGRETRPDPQQEAPRASAPYESYDVDALRGALQDQVDTLLTCTRQGREALKATVADIDALHFVSRGHARKEWLSYSGQGPEVWLKFWEEAASGVAEFGRLTQDVGVPPQGPSARPGVLAELETRQVVLRKMAGPLTVLLTFLEGQGARIRQVPKLFASQALIDRVDEFSARNKRNVCAALASLQKMDAIMEALRTRTGG